MSEAISGLSDSGQREPCSVVLVAPRLPPECDGVGDHAHRFASALVAGGTDVVVFSAGETASGHAYRLKRLGAAWNFRASVRGCLFLLRKRPCALLVEYTPFLFGSRSAAPFAFLLFAKALKIRSTLLVHEIFYTASTSSKKARLKAWYFDLRDKLILRMADRITVPNDLRRQKILDYSSRLSARTDIIPIAANVEPDRDYKRRIEPRAPIDLVAFGVVMPRRRYELAIEALAILRKRVDARLTIIGRVFDDAYRQRCMALATDRGLADYVTFTGSLSQQQISEQFASARVGIHTALEGATRSSGSLLSMFAHCLPVIALKTDHDDVDFSDILKQSDANADSLARALAEMLEDSAATEALGRRAGQRYETAFDWRAIASAVVQKT